MPRKNVARHLHYWMMLVFAASGSIAVAAPPIDAGSAGRNHSRMDRALESRASLLGSARGTGMSDIGASASLSGTATNAAASVGASASSLNSANAGGTSANGSAATGTTASETGRSTAANKTANGAPNGVMTDRSRRPDASFRLDGSTARGLRGDNATRMNPAGSAAAENRSDRRTSTDRTASLSDRSSRRTDAGAAGQARASEARESQGQKADSTKERSRLPFVSLAHAKKSDKSETAKSDKAERALLTMARSGNSAHGKVTQAESFLNRRLAQIDRMRDDALASGDTEKLHEADRLETLARSQYAQKTTGERKVGSAMKDFNQTPRPTETVPDSVDSTDVEVSSTTETDLGTSGDADLN